MQEPYCNHLIYLFVCPSVSTFLCDALTVQSFRSYKHFTELLCDAISQSSFSYIDFIFSLYAWYHERKTPTGIVIQPYCISHSESMSTSLVSYVRSVIPCTIFCLLQQHKNQKHYLDVQSDHQEDVNQLRLGSDAYLHTSHPVSHCSSVSLSQCSK